MFSILFEYSGISENAMQKLINIVKDQRFKPEEIPSSVYKLKVLV